MNCFFLWVPFFLIRFGLMSCLDKSAVRRAAQFAPMRGPEKAAYWVPDILPLDHPCRGAVVHRDV